MQGLYKIVSTIYVLLSPTHMSFPYGMFSLYRTWSLPSITQQKHSTFDFKTVIIPTSTAHAGRRLQIVGGGGEMAANLNEKECCQMAGKYLYELY